MATETTLYKFKADLTELKNLNSQLAQAKIKLDALKKGTIEYAATSKKMSAISSKMNGVSSAMKKTNTSAKKLNVTGNRMVGIFKSASIAIVAAFAFRAIVAGLKGVITIFAKFEHQMAAVKAISGATDVEFKELTASARALGESTVFTAIQVAELQEEFARLGFTTPQILAAQDATLDLAAATGESLSSAAAIAGSSLKAYGLEASQIVRVTNVMGSSFTGSALNLERFTQSMKFAAPVAKTAGFTIEETSAMLMTLADAGLHGSIAGNALKNIFIRLADANSNLNKSIGHTVQGLPQLIVELEKMKEETFGLTEATSLLDKRSAPAFLVLIDNIEKLSISADRLNKAEGDINRMAAIRLDTLTGDFTLLKSATEGLGIAVGETFNLALRQSTTSLTKWVQSLGQSDKFLNQVSGTFKIIQVVLTSYIARLALLRITTIATGRATVTLTRFTKNLAVHMRRGTVSTYAATLGLQAFKVALATTGIGLLIVGLGELIAWMGKTDQSMERAKFAVERLNGSFNEEMIALESLGTFTEERHDALREMTSTYSELVGLIDMEILSLEKLKLVKDIVNEGSGTQESIIATQLEIDKLIELRNTEEQNYNNRIRQIEDGNETRRQTTYYDADAEEYIIVHMAATTEQLVAEQVSRRDFDIDYQNSQITLKKTFLAEMKTLRTEEIIDEADANGIKLIKNESYRQQQRIENLAALEDFRKMSFGEQTIAKELHETKLEDLEKARDLLNTKVCIIRCGIIQVKLGKRFMINLQTNKELLMLKYQSLGNM